MSVFTTRIKAQYLGDWFDKRKDGRWLYDQTYELVVHSNPLGALQFKLPWLFGRQKTIKVVTTGYITEDGDLVTGAGATAKYATCSDFLYDWEIEHSETHVVRVPFLRTAIGFGDLFGSVAERFPLWFKMFFNGCYARREWFNHSLVFVPWD